MTKTVDEIDFIRLALKEDIGKGDITARALSLKGIRGEAEVVAKDSGIISGIDPFCRVFRELSRSISFRIYKKDGRSVKAGDRIIALDGALDILLMGERTAMNILSHLSGVATLTRRFVDAIRDSGAKILDTRKTMPGMRLWEKKAVAHGGATNHRFGLYDMYLIKENHIAAAGGLEAAMKAALVHRKRTGAKLEIEVKNLDELRIVLAYTPDYILLDNFTIPMIKKGVALVRAAERSLVLEASGNVTLDNVARIAATGVDRISVGAITHSAPALDLSFRVLDR